MTNTTTINDVAKKAGVGVGTVSRVINNAPFVGVRTGKLVREVIAELGYVPPTGGNRRGPRRSLGRSPAPREPAIDSKIVLLILGPHGLRWILDCAPIYSYVLAGIESSLNKLGRSLTVRQTSTWDDLAKVIKKDKARGVILFGQQEPEGEIPPALEKIAAVWVMGTPKRFQGDHILPDHIRIGTLAAEHGLSQGHRHFAYLGAAVGSPTWTIGYRADSFSWSVQQAGGSTLMLLDPGITLVAKGMNAPNEPALSAMMDRLAAAVPRPTVLMLQADMYAPSIYRHLLERGIQPGKDITIITCNNERPYLMGLHPAPVIIDTHGEAVGRRAVDQLLWRMENPKEPPMRLMVEPKLVLPEALESAV